MSTNRHDNSVARAAAIRHALGLHMHQPPDNLKLLIEENEWEAQQIIRCYERVPRYAGKFRDVARIHVGFSGILLEQFRSPEIIDRYRQFVDIPAMIESYRESDNIEIIGMGYYHPIFPLIPREDWDDHLASGRQIMAEMFGREPRGFWPPEMAFDMEMVPALVKAGYEYVVVDGVHVQPTKEGTPPDLYRPYFASRDGARIVVVPRDRDISNAQESGLDAGWFTNSVMNRVAESGIDPREVRDVEIGCPGPFFYYGVHATGAALGLLGAGVSEVEMSEFAPGEAAVMSFRHSCGAGGRLRVSLPPPSPWEAHLPPPLLGEAPCRESGPVESVPLLNPCLLGITIVGFFLPEE